MPVKQFLLEELIGEEAASKTSPRHLARAVRRSAQARGCSRQLVARNQDYEDLAADHYGVPLARVALRQA